MKRSLLALLLSAAPCWGQYVRLPAEVKAEPGQIVTVRADTDCAQVRWVALDLGLSLIPPDLLRDSRTAVALTSRAGRFRLLAYGAKDDQPSDPAVVTVVVGEAPPPGPGPGPTPPDPLVQTLQAAYDREGAADKMGLKSQLAALYRQAAEATARPEIQTWGALFDTLLQAATTLGLRGKLPLVQSALAAELTALLPTNRGQQFDATGRKLAADAFRRVSLALEGVR